MADFGRALLLHRTTATRRRGLRQGGAADVRGRRAPSSTRTSSDRRGRRVHGLPVLLPVPYACSSGQRLRRLPDRQLPHGGRLALAVRAARPSTSRSDAGLPSEEGRPAGPARIYRPAPDPDDPGRLRGHVIVFLLIHMVPGDPAGRSLGRARDRQAGGRDATSARGSTSRCWDAVTRFHARLCRRAIWASRSSTASRRRS